MLGTPELADEAKIDLEKISISRTIWLGFMSSLVSFIRCEPNKINRLREERPGSRAVKMLRDLLLRTRSRASCGSGERARLREHVCITGQYDVKGRVVHNRLCDGSLENAT